MQKLTTCLWFDKEAEEAVDFYSSIFKNLKKGRIIRYGEEGKEIHGQDAGSIMTVEFELEGQKFVALNGGPVFKFNESVSFMVNCETQDEIDYYWEKLGAGGDENARQCGWLKDKYGLSWQVTPPILDTMIADPDKEKSGRVMKSMLQMKKIDIEELKKAYEGN